MEDIKTAEITNEVQVNTPAPVTPTPQVETKPVESVKTETPVDSPAEIAARKQNAAFAAMRKAKREAERKATTASVATTPPATPVIQEQPKPEPVVVPPVPAQTNAEGIEVESEKAVIELCDDKDLAKIPGGVIEVMNLVDNDPRLVRLHSIDPKIAFREAKDMYLSKVGVTAPVAMPKSNTPSGGMAVGANNIDSLYAETQRYQVGTHSWNKAVDAFNAELARIRK